jgi:hypothetical protein
MLATSLFQVNGAAEPSSKNERGKVAASVGASEGLVNEVVEDPITGIEVTIERLGFENGSARDLVVGDIPLLIESIEVAGDTPSETNDRRFLG